MYNMYFKIEDVHVVTFYKTTQLYIPESRHDKTNKVTVRPAKIQISLGVFAVRTHILLVLSCRGSHRLGSHLIHYQVSI